MEEKAPNNIAELFELSQKPSTPTEIQAIKQEIFDSDLYNDMVDFSPVLQDLLARGNKSLATFNSLTQDIYLSLFKLKPELNADEAIKPEYRPNKQIIEAMMHNEDFQSMHTMTRLDSVAAGMGAQVLAEKILNQLEAMGNMDATPNVNSEQPADKSEDNTPNKAQKLLSAIQDNINDTCESANREMEGVMDMGKAWGLEPGNPNTRVSYQNKKKALERLRNNPKLKSLTDMVGRFRQIAINCYKKASEGVSSIKEVSVGGDLEMVMPSEKMLLSNNTTRKDFYRRYHQQELLQYQSNGVNPKGRGPMVVCCDVSGSMRGKAEEWSKAMVIALAEVAQRERRDFACILFNSQLVGTWLIPRGIFDPGAIIDIAEQFPGGGTNFNYPLEKSLELINTSKFKNADVIFITDGKCEVPDELLNRLNQVKARKEFMILTVLIDVDDKTIDGVAGFSDDLIAISSLTDLNDKIADKLISNL